ncbi:hypothetical protein [Nonomuraea sp. NPDC050643]|uniref:hypothetical protein n=1 Tax=Nonomuraea sp. NPDC050643 TaxID=3155660 RepID=UPI0033D12331
MFPAPVTGPAFVEEGGERGFVIDPRVIGEGQTGVLEFSVSEHSSTVVAGIWAAVGRNPIAECELVDTTDAPLSH